MYAVQKTIPLSFKEQLQDQQLPDRVFALILSSMIFFGKKRDGIPKRRSSSTNSGHRSTCDAAHNSSSTDKKPNIARQATSTFRHLAISSHVLSPSKQSVKSETLLISLTTKNFLDIDPSAQNLPPISIY
jgi:hypothetical protein